MKKKRFSVEQIIGVLKQAQVGVPVAEVIRKAAISEQTFYRWKAKYAGLEVDQVRQMAQLQEENQRLKRLVADLTLDKTMLKSVIRINRMELASLRHELAFVSAEFGQHERTCCKQLSADRADGTAMSRGRLETRRCARTYKRSRDSDIGGMQLSLFAARVALFAASGFDGLLPARPAA